VYPASGGSYAYNASSPTGLAQYPLRDLTFAKAPGTIPARPGVAAQSYVYTLTNLDGTTDRFDANGNLVEQADRFGNLIDLTWRQSGSWWQPVSVADNYGQVTTFDYATAGQVKVTAPGGLTTKTVYTSPTVTTVTAPSGLITQTTTDVTGRTVKVTDNVSGQALVQDPAARTVQTDTYRADGGQVSTTTPAGTTTTTLDPLGRPTQVVASGGITQTDTYNDVANTQKVSLLAAGAGPSDPTSATTTGFNDLNQPVSATTSYPDNTPQTSSAQSYDGLGRVDSYTAGNVTATPDYAGTGGLQTGTTLTPTDATSFPGQPVTTEPATR
jgi:hypothetical protein